MTFDEFIWAKGNATLEKMVKDCEWESFTTVDHYLKDLLRQYFYVGGMPEAVLEWVTTEDVLNVRDIQNRILVSYANDILQRYGFSLRICRHRIQGTHIVSIKDSIIQSCD